MTLPPPVLRATGLCYEPELALRQLGAADPPLARLIERVGEFGLRPRRTQSLFAALARAIVYQQLTGAAAATILARVCRLVEPGRLPRPAELLALPPERLRSAGLSAAKTAALRDLAARALDGTVPTMARARTMSDEELIERLDVVRGVGRWTVEMLLIFRLGRPDVFPVHDLGVRKGYARTFGKRKLPEPAAMLRHAERWRPYRSVASWYLWRALEL